MGQRTQRPYRNTPLLEAYVDHGTDRDKAGVAAEFADRLLRYVSDAATRTDAELIDGQGVFEAVQQEALELRRLALQIGIPAARDIVNEQELAHRDLHYEGIRETMQLD